MATTNIQNAVAGEKFTYVFIPCVDSKPMEERTESAEGGLEQDCLTKTLREGSEVGPNIDITAITVPMAANNNIAISLYCGGNSNTPQLPVNTRVMGVMRACGLQPTGDIKGDVVLSRYFDDEDKNIWKRIDLSVNECQSDSSWVVSAKQRNQGRVSGGSSLSGILQKTATNNTLTAQQPQGQNFTKEINGCTFIQTPDEVELTVPLPSEGCSKKDIHIKFASARLEVKLAGKSVLKGKLGGVIDLDGSTWTLDGNGSVIITMEKKDMNQDWSLAIEQDSSS